MSNEERQALLKMVDLIENLTVKIDALERALIERGVLLNGERDKWEQEYMLAASSDTMAVRGKISAR
jgi:hypothetical protein